MEELSLTGRRRYRKTQCGFVVEVEFSFFDRDPVEGEPRWFNRWRRARRSDLLDAPTIPHERESE